MEIIYFIKNRLSISEIKRITGISEHAIKSQVVSKLREIGINNFEYELLTRLLTDSEMGNNAIKLDLVSQIKQLKIDGKLGKTEQNILAKIQQGIGFTALYKIIGVSKHGLNAQLRSILTKLKIKNIEYSLLSVLFKPKK